MKKNILFISVCALSVLMISCERNVFEKPNTKITEKQNDFSIERDPSLTFDFPYSTKDFNQLMMAHEQKATWPKIKVSLTFGGWGWQNPNPCNGCENCGCCIGLCIQGASSSEMTNNPLTQEEIEDGWFLFDYVDDPENDRIVLIPNANIDNGDGYFHNDDDNLLSEDVCDYLERTIKLEMGSYEIDYSDERFEYGVVVVNTL